MVVSRFYFSGRKDVKEKQQMRIKMTVFFVKIPTPPQKNDFASGSKTNPNKMRHFQKSGSCVSSPTSRRSNGLRTVHRSEEPQYDTTFEHK